MKQHRTVIHFGGVYAWLRAFASLGLGTLGSAGLFTCVVALKPVAAEFDATRSEVALAYAATAIGLGLGGIFMGWLSDRVGVMWPALIGAGAMSLGFVVAGSATQLWVYILAHGLLIGMLGNGAVMVSLIADITRWFNANRGIAVAIVISGNYAAGTLWPTFVQHGIGTIGWRDTYHVIAGICLIGMSLLALVMWRRAPIESGSQEPTDTPGRPLRLTPRAAQLFLCAAGFGCCTAMAMPQAHIVAHATDLGHAATQGAQMLSLMLGCGVISRLGFGWLSDHIGGLRTILVGAALQAVALASFMPLTGIDALYWASALFGLAQGGIVPAYAIIIRRHFPASDIGWRVGLIMFFTLCGMAFGGWVAGALYDLTGSYQAAFINALVFNALNIVIVIGLLANTGFAKQA